MNTLYIVCDATSLIICYGNNINQQNESETFILLIDIIAMEDNYWGCIADYTDYTVQLLKAHKPRRQGSFGRGPLTFAYIDPVESKKEIRGPLVRLGNFQPNANNYNKYCWPWILFWLYNKIARFRQIAEMTQIWIIMKLKYQLLEHFVSNRLCQGKAEGNLQWRQIYLSLKNGYSLRSI